MKFGFDLKGFGGVMRKLWRFEEWWLGFLREREVRDEEKWMKCLF